MQKFRTLLVREQLSKDFDRVIGSSGDTPEKVYQIMKLLGADMQPEEHMWAVHLNTQNRISGVTEVSIGGLAQTAANPAEVFRTAILAGTAALVMVHNHPSGDCTPSPEDLLATKRLVEVGRLIGIPIVEHLILGDDNYFSMYNFNDLIFTD